MFPHLGTLTLTDFFSLFSKEFPEEKYNSLFTCPYMFSCVCPWLWLVYVFWHVYVSVCLYACWSSPVYMAFSIYMSMYVSISISMSLAMSCSYLSLCLPSIVIYTWMGKIYCIMIWIKLLRSGGLVCMDWYLNWSQ